MSARVASTLWMRLDRLLHVGVEVLHAERQAIEAEGPQRLELLERRHARIDFERESRAPGSIVKCRSTSSCSVAHLVGREIAGRATAPVVLHDAAPPPSARATIRISRTR